MCTHQVITKLIGMENEPDLAYTSKKDQAELLTKVLAASDKEADEEDLSSLVRHTIMAIISVALKLSDRIASSPDLIPILHAESSMQQSSTVCNIEKLVCSSCLRVRG